MTTAPGDRAERLAAAVADAGFEMAIVGDLVRPGDSVRDAMADVTWLTGYTGSSALTVIGADVRAFVTDFRYVTTARATVPESFTVIDGSDDMLAAVGGLLGGRVAIDPAKTSLKSHGKLLDKVGDGVEVVAGEDLVRDLRRVKDGAEIEAIATAAELTDAVYGWIGERGLAGRSEREVALAAEQRMRELGAEGPSFPAIVAAGPNAALPHAVPGDREIGRGEYVIVDMGAIVDGYCSDCTRTLVEGDPDPARRDVYELVLAAQEAALAAIAAGAGGRAVDAVARELIAEAGYGEQFGHGLGHGVGIEVHEPPRLSMRSDDTLLAGDVVTVEPGIYVPGAFGVRIEDLVVVTDGGHRNLSGHPR